MRDDELFERMRDDELFERMRDDELFERADRTIEFYKADPQGIGTEKPCECAQRAIETGYMELDPDCKANRCKELRA